MNQSFSLKKNETFSLTKLAAGISNLYAGLNWSPAKVGEKIDLDLVLIAVGADGKVINQKHEECFLFFGNNGRDINADLGIVTPKAYYITPDNRDGRDDPTKPDDEAIFITDSLIDPAIQEMRLFVTYWDAKGRTLTDVDSVTLRIAPLNDKPDFDNEVTYNVRDYGSSQGVHMATLKRNPIGGWDIVAVGEPTGDLHSVMTVYGLMEKAA